VKHFSLDDSIGFNANAAANLLKKELNKQFANAGIALTAEQWMILNRLWEQDGVSMSDLAKRTYRDNASITRTLLLLQEKDFVVLKDDVSDDRYWKIFLTGKGRKIREKLIPCAEKVLAKATKGMAAAEVAQVNELCRKIIRDLT
jgi:DNA-binding MarR family transcriptional regulator